MKIIGHDGKSRYFRSLDQNKVKCICCNTEFDVHKGQLAEDLKLHVCPEKELDRDLLEIAQNFEQIILDQKKLVDSETRM
jgi:hypothetical protein